MVKPIINVIPPKIPAKYNGWDAWHALVLTLNAVLSVRGSWFNMGVIPLVLAAWVLHRRTVATRRRRVVRDADRLLDIRVSILEQYHQQVVAHGPLFAYSVLEGLVGESGMKSLGIWKSPAELNALADEEAT